jgi:hypothetical protein
MAEIPGDNVDTFLLKSNIVNPLRPTYMTFLDATTIAYAL